jgi:hypothetical protein
MSARTPHRLLRCTYGVQFEVPGDLPGARFVGLRSIVIKQNFENSPPRLKESVMLVLVDWRSIMSIGRSEQLPYLDL